MFNIKIGAASLNLTALSFAENKACILQAIAKARAEGVELLCLPEMCIPSYGCEDGFLSPFVADESLRILQELLPATKGMVVAFGLPVLFGKHRIAASALVADGELLGFVGKHTLAGDGLHYEPRWFRSWPAQEVSHIDCFGKSYPLGDIFFDVGGVRIGFEVCEDAWSAQRFSYHFAGNVDVILNPSASHFAFGKFGVRQRIVQEGSRAFSVAYVYSNLMGVDSGRVIFDGGCMVAAHGEIVASGQRFAYSDVQLTTAVVDVKRLRSEYAARMATMPVEQASKRIVAPFQWGGREQYMPSDPIGPQLPLSKHEEFAQSVSLGLFDYLRKSGLEGFVVSLSGGADSSAVSVLVNLMWRYAVQDIGKDAVFKRLPWLATEKNPMAKLLTCVYQGTKQNSPQTRESARELAKFLGATFFEWEIDDAVATYVGLITKATGKQPTWETDDLALQNIQARARAPGIWLLANLRNALLLNTSNRSEAAVGYATMDGDTAGGLNPIGGIDKAFLLEWLKWAEQSAIGGGITGLKYVNKLQPSAELRPGQNQTDEKDLMPYHVLDKLEEWAIRDKLAPADVLALALKRFPDVPAATTRGYVKKFFALWGANQWKRERFAPAFHLDDTNLDPKTWCRFPILSGKYWTGALE